MKHKYSRDDIVKSETFDLVLYGSRDVIREYKKEQQKVSDAQIEAGIYGLIQTQKINSFYKLVNEIRTKHPDWYSLFSKKFWIYKAYVETSTFGKSGDIESEYAQLQADYIDLQSKVYEFLQTTYPEIEIIALNEFFSKL